MEETLVSSRIPQAKKEAGVSILSRLGATTSDLINSAFDYVIATQQLPSAALEAQKGTRDTVSLAKFVSESTLAIDWGQEARSYKEILRERKVADYERLA